MPNSPKFQDTGQKSNGGISNSQIFGESLINENCHKFRTSNDIDMKLGWVTKLDKRNTTTSEKIWQWRHIGKLWLWANPEAEFQMHGL